MGHKILKIRILNQSCSRYYEKDTNQCPFFLLQKKRPWASFTFYPYPRLCNIRKAFLDPHQNIKAKTGFGIGLISPPFFLKSSFEPLAVFPSKLFSKK